MRAWLEVCDWVQAPPLAVIGRWLETAFAQNRVIIHLLVASKNWYKGKEFLNAAKLATSRSCRYFSASVFVSAGCTGYVCEVRSTEKAFLACTLERCALELCPFLVSRISSSAVPWPIDLNCNNLGLYAGSKQNFRGDEAKTTSCRIHFNIVVASLSENLLCSISHSRILLVQNYLKIDILIDIFYL